MIRKKFPDCNIPVVLVTTHVDKLMLERDGSDLVYAARIEYLVHSMPGEALAARLAEARARPRPKKRPTIA